MVLCDLPYGTTGNKWDTVIPFDELWRQYKRIIKDHGAICLFGQEPFSSIMRTSNLKMYRYDWIWHKTAPTRFLLAHKMPLSCYETISVFYKHLPIYNPQMRTGFKPYAKTVAIGDFTNRDSNYGGYKNIGAKSSGNRYPVNIIKFKNSNHSHLLHPTQKPVALLEYLIKTYTNKSDLVLDNCMGSGSTGIACVNIGRSFIGMELEPKYFEIAKERINKANE